jgi:hypothetical protein
VLLLQALQALKDSTPLLYSPHALQDFQCEWEGPKVGHMELVEQDGVMVYQQVRATALQAYMHRRLQLQCIHAYGDDVCRMNGLMLKLYQQVWAPVLWCFVAADVAECCLLSVRDL